MPNILPYGGSVIVVVVTAVAIVAVRFISKKTIQRSNSWPYQRQLVTVAVVLLGLFVAIGMLPIAGDTKNQLLSIMGLVLTAIIALSSTTLVGNAMAGIMLRLMHEFKAGDFVELDEWVGRVTDLGMFHTEIQTMSRDFVSIPNLLLAQHAVKVTRRSGTFINVGVSLAYTIDHRKAEQVLQDAAKSCDLTESFVFVEELLDHAVRYRLYGLLEKSEERLSRTSELHKAVLDALHFEGLEIASPVLMDRREYRQGFRFIPVGTKKGKPKVASSAIEEKAFDKAEEAKDLEELKEKQESLVEVLSKKEKEPPSEVQKEKIVEKLDKIKEEITKKEEKKQKGD
jgi:small-conductance mechanosensitive channel